MTLSKSWETTSGLLDEYEMTIAEAWFKKDPAYQEGKATVLAIRGEAELDGEVLDDEKQNYYSLGDGWEPEDGGESTAHNSGKVQFNQNSSMGRFITAIIGCGQDAISAVAARGESTEAATFRGLRFRFERKRFLFKDKEGNEREYYVELPVEFLGEEEIGGSGRKPAAKKATPAKPASGGRRKAADEPEADDAEEAPAEEKPARRRRAPKADDTLRAEVVEFAATWEEHADFMNAVLDSEEFPRADDVQNNEEILNDILDEEGSIWQESR